MGRQRCAPTISTQIDGSLHALTDVYSLWTGFTRFSFNLILSCCFLWSIFIEFSLPCRCLFSNLLVLIGVYRGLHWSEHNGTWWNPVIGRWFNELTLTLKWKHQRWIAKSPWPSSVTRFFLRIFFALSLYWSVIECWALLSCSLVFFPFSRSRSFYLSLYATQSRSGAVSAPVASDRMGLMVALPFHSCPYFSVDSWKSVFRSISLDLSLVNVRLDAVIVANQWELDEFLVTTWFVYYYAREYYSSMKSNQMYRETDFKLWCDRSFLTTNDVHWGKNPTLIRWDFHSK